jgi:hypothetical protein
MTIASWDNHSRNEDALIDDTSAGFEIIGKKARVGTTK